jgi:hypothetical protein
MLPDNADRRVEECMIDDCQSGDRTLPFALLFLQGRENRGDEFGSLENSIRSVHGATLVETRRKSGTRVNALDKYVVVVVVGRKEGEFC